MAEHDLPIPRPQRTTWAPSGEPRARDWSWIWQAVSGTLLLFLVTLHMVANHFVVPEGLRNYQEVVAYLSNPLIVVLEVAFLFVVTWHGLLGLRAVLFDFGFSAGIERTITRILVVVGILTIGYGLWLTATIIGQG